MTAPNPSEPNATTPAPSSSAPPSGPAAESWKAPAHSLFAGRTAEEVLGIAEMAAATLQKFNQQVPQAPVAPVQPVSRFDLDIPDDDYVQARQIKQLLLQAQNQQPVDQVARRQNIQLSIAQLQSNPKYKTAFERWPNEIWAEWNKLHPDYVALDTLETCIKMVLSSHIDELAAEKAQRIVNESHPTIRSGTGGSGGVPNTQSSLLETGPSDMVARLRAVGIQDEATLRQQCQGTGISPEQYLAELEKYGKGAVIRG
jgi:hypothetical protein